MYRFGDGTPFPLRENFVETLVAAVDCCVALYLIEARVEEHEARVREACRRAAEEERRLDALYGLVEGALAPLLANKEQDGGRVTEQAAVRIFESAATIIRNSRSGLVRKREQAENAALPEGARTGVQGALAAFFRRCQLPHTEWQVHWQAGGEEAATAELGARASRDLEFVFRAAFAADSFWARPIAMADLFRGPVTATLSAGKGRQRSLRLDPLILTEVQLGSGRDAMVLRESNKRAGPGLHILLPRSGESAPLVVEVDKHDQSRGQPFYLDDASAAGAVLGAWRALEREMPGLIASRHELVLARLGGRAISEIEHPGPLAESILLSLAPLVREMRIRSRVPGELVLKRDVAADRREEMFVPRQALWNKLAGLPLRHRQLFEAIGLGNEATYEFVGRVGQKQTRSRTSASPIPAESPRAAEEALSEVELTRARDETSEVSEVSGVIDRVSA